MYQHHNPLYEPNVVRTYLRKFERLQVLMVRPTPVGHPSGSVHYIHLLWVVTRHLAIHWIYQSWAPFGHLLFNGATINRAVDQPLGIYHSLCQPLEGYPLGVHCIVGISLGSIQVLTIYSTHLNWVTLVAFKFHSMPSCGQSKDVYCSLDIASEVAFVSHDQQIYLLLGSLQMSTMYYPGQVYWPPFMQAFKYFIFYYVLDHHQQSLQTYLWIHPRVAYL